jgi:hypothetical protein
VAYDHRDVIIAQHNKLTADRAAAAGQYERARLNEDSDGTMWAADTIVEIDAKLVALNRIANDFVAGQQQAQQCNKYNLTSDEVAIARGNGSGDARLSNDDRDRIYAEQKAKYQRMRASGEYRDDQGSVRR